MKFIDLFSGIGGFRYGLEVCNRNGKAKKRNGETDPSIKGVQKCDESISSNRNTTITNRGQEKFHCVYSNEWDKYANQIYKKHYGECDTRDIRTVDAKDIPDHDLLCGGFPCQSFSIAGKRRGFDDTRGTLFFEIARILKEKRPRLCLLENVKGLLSHDNGRTFKTIISTLVELGYDIQWQVLNSKNFGVPQNRERVFIIGHLRGTPRPKVFPIGESNEWDSEARTKGKLRGSDTASALKRRDYKGGTTFINELEYIGGVISKRDMWLKDGKQNSRNFSQGQRVYGTKGISSTLAGNAGGLGGKTGLYQTDMKIRRLTPTECERLQGFPDGWTEGISDTQKYKCLGNAVTTYVIEFIGSRLIL